MNDLVSIIVPVYNVEKYLEKCLNSIVNQTYYNLEIIVINDGSTDKSDEICRRFYTEDSRVIYINKKNGGLSSARNAGLNIAKGSYISFVDSDDYLEVNFIEKLLCLCKKSEADIGCCDFYRTSALNEQELNYKEYYYNSDEILDELLTDQISAHVWNKLYKRSMFSQIRFPEGKNFEDLFTMHLLFFESKKIAFTNEKMYFYNDSNITSISNDLNKAAFNKLCIAEAFIERYYFADKLNRKCTDILFEIAVKQSTDSYREQKTLNQKIESEIIDKFIVKKIMKILFSIRIDPIKKYYALIIYFHNFSNRRRVN